MVEIEVSSEVGASADVVWRHAVSMDGVNYELSPWLRMGVPRAARGLSVDRAPLGMTAFRSPLLAGRLLPIDLHRLQIDELGPGNRFQERSDSLAQRFWEHERVVEATGESSCRVTDRLRFEPRVRAAERVAGPIVRRLFEHRHERLRSRFGA